jgi:hypothetical protein
MTNSRATAFPAEKIKDEICYQDSYVNDKQGRHWSYQFSVDQKSTQDKGGVLGKERDSHASEN